MVFTALAPVSPAISPISNDPAHPSRAKTAPARTVMNCYEFFERVFPECGFLDFTDGMYLGNPALPYEQAQANQIDWLLDQVGCAAGTRLLDIGCGNGTLVEAAQRRGARATGVTISTPQVHRCRRRGLDVQLRDYRHLPDEWTGQFDAIVANGSIEHFVQPEDVQAERDDAVYQDLFAICRRLLRPRGGKFATTVIHQHEATPRISPEDMRKNPFRFRWGSSRFHYALLQRGFGGYYPQLGQLERCAAPHFRLIAEVDGTEDYRLTSEYWFAQVRKKLFTWKTGTRVGSRLLGHWLRHPVHAATMCVCLFVAESWQRQFRGNPAPTRLLRHVWQAGG